MILRSYQDRDVSRIRASFQQGAKRICYAAPTGSGKTVLFCTSRIAARSGASGSPFIVHRQELIDQTCKALAAEGVRLRRHRRRLSGEPRRARCKSAWRRRW